jgi:threonine/homoserine/homoserine lactone efflux protein
MELLLPLASFAFVASITPGPNNMMLSASGIAFGLRRTVPHMCGVWVGFALLLMLCGAGVGAVIVRFPALAFALKTIGTVYLLYLAWTMRHALEPRAQSAAMRPLKFAEAVAFQFVNPKGWVMAVTAVSVFVPDLEPRWRAVALMCAVFSAINLPCVGSWAVLGAGLKGWLARNPRRRKLCSAGVVVLTLYAVVAMWL